ncbi:nucleotide sugar dehydrogenase [Nocardia sp. CNY236]|uniref:nucleotide sugar dehydrogenase n=1 Tax=Nocardia sp. CNY236 TaxID=1169152 RepID=UPI0018C9AB9B|nr:nucleotide sugar dehydrogenase [Nocardia sp. CNY236]
MMTPPTRQQPVPPRTRQPRRVAVIGQGHMGLVVSVLATEAGHSVVGYDTDPVRILRVSSASEDLGEVPRDRLAQAIATGRFTATTDAAALYGFEVAVISVSTPLAAGRPDLRLLEAAAKTVAAHARPGCVVIVESTTWPGTTDEIVIPALESSGLRAGVNLHVGYTPERINPGDGIDAMVTIPKIVSGADAASLALVTEFWETLVDTVVLAPDMRTAELTKLIENTFRLVNISLVNEIAHHARDLGADIWSAIGLATSKPYGFMPFTPGIGAGGHCIPVAPRYLAWRIGETGGTPAGLIEMALAVNDAAPVWVAERILTGLTQRGIGTGQAVVLVAGITYKPNVGDVRGSAAAAVIAHLRGRGVWVLVYDPVAEYAAEVLRVVTPELIAAVSAVAVLVAHDHLDTDALAAADYVFDACGILPRTPNIELL